MVEASIKVQFTEERGDAGQSSIAALPQSNEAPHRSVILKNSNTTKSVVYAPDQRRTIPVFTNQKAEMSVLAKRLKEARQRAGLSQEKLGIESGLDPMSASTRMNRYELGKRTPDWLLVERIAAVLKVPTSYFYASADDEAELLLVFHRLSKKHRAAVVAFAGGNAP